jgi:hypothetical protein
MGDSMKFALLAATALIASSFSPIALPALVGEAAALPSPNVLLCTDNNLLGPSQNGHFWGNPYILPVRNIVSGTLDGPTSIPGGGTRYVGLEAISLQAVIQRCPVMNRAGHPTGEYQDVQLTAAHHTTFVIECEHTSGESVPPPYVDCQISHLTGSSGDDR